MPSREPCENDPNSATSISQPLPDGGRRRIGGDHGKPDSTVTSRNLSLRRRWRVCLRHLRNAWSQGETRSARRERASLILVAHFNGGAVREADLHAAKADGRHLSADTRGAANCLPRLVIGGRQNRILTPNWIGNDQRELSSLMSLRPSSMSQSTSDRPPM
jgi:hypothetical protein